MPMELTRNELARLMAKTSIGVTRFYNGPCPHEVGNKILLAFGKDGEGRPQIVARATLMSVRPFEVRDRRANTAEAREEAAKEGWASPAEWWGHFSMMYGELEDSAVLHRLQLSVENRVEQVADSGHPMPMLQ
jgi:hypothetical protein